MHVGEQKLFLKVRDIIMPNYDSIEKKLKENYEDAKFALLMHKAASFEGDDLLEENERLRADPDFCVPPAIEKAARTTINRTFARDNARRALRVTGKVLTKVAMAVLVLNIAFVTLFSTASAFRANVLNFVYNTYDVATSVTLNGNENDKTLNHKVHELPWIPEGYSLYSSEAMDSSDFVTEYRNSDNMRIRYKSITGNAITQYDTENADVSNITVSGYEGLLIKKTTEIGEKQTAVWGDTNNNQIYSIMADNIPSDDFQTILNCLK